ncbi:hypothetical protein RHAB21_03457 [Pseudorhizobium halotolerans]|uniref:Uncharacterized protein n=1 Tax=Pseudorhizobium halotolerans TaxID=1233081 RepID=A0ABN7JWV5_9HYPH|nr:hypothetical protein RHAB21_03457 [Pseudorhizobium halotolerans]
MPNTDKNTQQDQKKASQTASQSSGKEKVLISTES